MALIQIVNYYEFDNFHQDRNHIIRVITDEKLEDGTIEKWASSPFPLGNYVKENLAGIDNATTIIRDLDWTLSSGIKTKNIKVIYADQSFFQMFNFPLEKGVYSNEPNTVVLSYETAQWFFRESNPIGNILEHPKYGNFKVVGVLKHYNQQKTQFKTDVFVSAASYLTINKTIDWSVLNAHTFVKVANEVTAVNFNDQLSKTSNIINKLIGSSTKRKLLFKGQTFTEISPAKDILKNDPYVQDVRSITINFAFQLIMLLLASLNYINLTLARSMNRSREVGVRKVAGATKTQLVLQFLVESVLISYIALSIGLFLLWLIKNQIHVSWLTWEIDHLGYLILIFFIFNLFLGLIAGASPSLILASFQPVNVLKGNLMPASFGKIGFRKTLIIAQFTIALVYIFFIGHAYNQINYMATDNENYQRNGILNVNMVGENYKQFATDISRMKDVQNVGYTSLNFGNKPIQSSIKNIKDETSNLAFYYAVDHNFIENMRLKFVAGNNLIKSNSELPSPLIVVNQKTIEKLNLGSEQEAIGKQLILNDTLSATIVGVVENFCHYDYEHKIEPVVFQYKPAAFRVMCLKINSVVDRKALETTIKNVWIKYNPYQEINFSWLDKDMYERYYPYDEMQLMGLESVVIFVIAILGLIGILIYSLEKRTKEIGIRKVIGATTFEIIKLMSDNFVKLLAVATAIAVPSGIAIGLYMDSYFVFNNGVGYLTMGLLLLIVIGVALCAVGYFSWVAAQTNPAKTLKAE
ncbi:ABC transporter permease [Spirosoma flavus]